MLLSELYSTRRLIERESKGKRDGRESPIIQDICQKLRLSRKNCVCTRNRTRTPAPKASSLCNTTRCKKMQRITAYAIRKSTFIRLNDANEDDCWDIIMWMDHRASEETEIINSLGHPGCCKRFSGLVFET